MAKKVDKEEKKGIEQKASREVGLRSGCRLPRQRSGGGDRAEGIRGGWPEIRM